MAPNILIYMTDHERGDVLLPDHPCIAPNAARLAQEGVLFTQAYNCNPKCAPARACLLTGRYSWQLEEACNHTPFLADK